MQHWIPMNVLLYMTGGCESKGPKEDVSYLSFFLSFALSRRHCQI